MIGNSCLLVVTTVVGYETGKHYLKQNSSLLVIAIVISEVHGLDTPDAADAAENEAVSLIGFVGGVKRAKLARRHLEGVR